METSSTVNDLYKKFLYPKSLLKTWIKGFLEPTIRSQKYSAVGCSSYITYFFSSVDKLIDRIWIMPQSRAIHTVKNFFYTTLCTGNKFFTIQSSGSVYNRFAYGENLPEFSDRICFFFLQYTLNYPKIFFFTLLVRTSITTFTYVSTSLYNNDWPDCSKCKSFFIILECVKENSKSYSM
jgi:hypothetical protein